MITSKTTLRAAPRLHQLRSTSICQRRIAFHAYSPYATRRRQHFVRSVALVSAIGSVAVLYRWYFAGTLIRDAYAESPEAPLQPELVFEESRYKEGASKEETRAIISSQHLQIKKSWENPGVWCWGANDGNVVAPDAKGNLVKNPRWFPFFDGVLLRDMKLTREFGAAISEKGDLLQWGQAFSGNNTTPETTLKGKDLVSLAISKDRILALSKSGTVYSLSVSREEQQDGPKPLESSWWGWRTSRSPISYRSLTPKNLEWSEKVTSIASGLEHAIILTSKGRVFSAASGSEDFPTRGQLGIPGLTWFTRPDGPYDMPHEIQSLHGFRVEQIACGDLHSVALDRRGRVFAWGDNLRGQLGIGDTSAEAVFVDTPAIVPISKLYTGTSQTPVVTSITAGGNTTFLTVDATRVVPADATSDTISGAIRGAGRITADTWACGHGIYGQLGNGRWTHVQSLPTKILPLSGLFEYDEKACRAIPIRIRQISAGANHCAAVLDNVTYLDASEKTSENDTNWGADVLFFGNNEFYQLGTGRRNNVTSPVYIAPLDRIAEVKEGGRPKQEIHRFHATPRSTVKVGGRWVSFEQRVVCGRGVTAVYSGV